MHPISFIKGHPVATVSLLAAGMILGPWLTATLAKTTGVDISLPSVGSGG
jgi:hypothetical protein